jgi:hypothetical protein
LTSAVREVSSFLTAAVNARGYNLAISQAVELTACQCPPMTAWQIAKPKISDANTNEIFHTIANSFEHTANLAIDSLSQDNAQAHGRHGMESRNPCSLAVEKNSAHQFRREFRVPWAIQCHFVFLLNFVTWMR